LTLSDSRHSDGGGFARAVLVEKAVDVAALDPEREAVNGHAPPSTRGQSFCLQANVRHQRSFCLQLDRVAQTVISIKSGQ
jgi:hypothetical protein